MWGSPVPHAGKKTITYKIKEGRATSHKRNAVLYDLGLSLYLSTHPLRYQQCMDLSPWRSCFFLFPRRPCSCWARPLGLEWWAGSLHWGLHWWTWPPATGAGWWIALHLTGMTAVKLKSAPKWSITSGTHKGWQSGSCRFNFGELRCLLFIRPVLIYLGPRAWGRGSSCFSCLNDIFRVPTWLSFLCQLLMGTVQTCTARGADVSAWPAKRIPFG